MGVEEYIMGKKFNTLTREWDKEPVDNIKELRKVIPDAGITIYSDGRVEFTRDLSASEMSKVEEKL